MTNSHYPFIDTISVFAHTPASYAEYLRSIINHTAKVKRQKKLRAKEKRDAYKPKPRAWSFRVNPKGTPIITIRGRKPLFLYRSEYLEMLNDNPTNHASIHAGLTRRTIMIKEDPK